MHDSLNNGTDRLNSLPPKSSLPYSPSLPIRAYVGDMVSSLLRPIAFQRSLVACANCREPWGFESETTGHPQFYTLQGRSALLETEEGEIHRIQEGDIIMLPCGSAHRIFDGESERSAPLRYPLNDGPSMSFRQDVYRLEREGQFSRSDFDRVAFDGDREKSTDLSTYIMCLEPTSTRTILKMLPPVIHLRNEDGAFPDWFLSLTSLSSCEARRPRHGRGAVHERLAEILFIETILAHFDQLNRMGIDADNLALEPPIARALEAMHQDPKKHRNLQSMAREVGMSRASFAATFKDVVGIGPMTYLRQLRLEMSIEKLHSNMNIAEVATLSGYSSEEAYRRAFKREYGVSPRSFSRRC